MAEHIIIERKGALGVITLNAPKRLNSLTLPMIEELDARLREWRDDERISCVFLQGAGDKAFCAGGDVRRLHDAIIAQGRKDRSAPAPECLEFFTKEYRLDYAIHRYPKPLIVWGDGIVMGGGIGLMVGASHRIVTERSKLAMPEITIGLYPDVGGTWFLDRMPAGWGEYLGVTGTRLDASDCLFLGLADHFISTELKTPLREALSKCRWGSQDVNHGLASDVLRMFAAKSGDPAPSKARAHEKLVKELAGARSPRELRSRLEALPEKDHWILAGIRGLDAGSPSSAFIIFEQLRRGRGARLEDIFRSELNLSLQCTLHPDFCEGVRALLVEKDQCPRWQPAKLDEVTPQWVDSYFAPLWDDDGHPLRTLGME